MNIKWNEVTWYSKLLSAIFLLLCVPLLTFYIGMQYEAVRMISPIRFETPYRPFVSKNYGVRFEYPAVWHVVENPVAKDDGVHDNQLIALYTPEAYRSWQKCLSENPKETFLNCSALSAAESALFFLGENATCESLSNPANYPGCKDEKFGFTYQKNISSDTVGETLYYNVNSPDGKQAIEIDPENEITPNGNESVLRHVAESMIFAK